MNMYQPVCIPSTARPGRLARPVLLAVVLLSLTAVSSRTFAQAAADPAKPKKIVFFAGPRDHGGGARHDYPGDLQVLAKCLETSSNLKGVTTTLHVGSVLTNIMDYRDADCFVILSSADARPGETHPLFPPNNLTDRKDYTGETKELLNEFDKMVKSGKGVVILHYAIEATNLKAKDYYMQWLGGVWRDGRWSNPLGQWSIKPIEASKGHPVLRGVNPFDYRDEIFCPNQAEPRDPRRTDLLFASTDRSNQGTRTNVVAAWAYQRDDAGRGFFFGGIDYHNAMLNENYRRFLLNGIAWAAKMEIPTGGIQSVYDPASEKK
jgi:type 1 glutamine amidotransferase